MADNSAMDTACSRCAAAVMANDRFCPHCGHGLAAMLPAKHAGIPAPLVADICQRCSAPKQHGDDFCSNCGRQYASDTAPKEASPQVMPVAVPAARPPHMPKPVPAVSTPAVRPVSSPPKAVDTLKSKPFVVIAAGALLFIVFIGIVSRAGQGQQSNATPAYNTSQLSAALPTGTPAPATVPAAAGPLSAEDQQAFYQYSAQGLSLGNYLWCRQTLLATGEPLSNVTSYLVSLKHAADASAEDLHVVASAGCQIAAADGSIARAERQVEILTAYEARFPGSGIFQIAENAATGKPYQADLAKTRMSLDGLAGGQVDTFPLQKTIDDIAAASATRTNNHP